MQQTNSSKHKNPKTGLWLLLLFVSPLVAASLLFIFNDHFQFKSVCSGQLITPPIESQTLSFHDDALLGKWQLLYVVPEQCDSACQNDQKMLNAIHIALGKEQKRVLKRGILPSVLPEPLRKQFGENGLWVIDPKGWIILHYTSLSDPKGILKDIRRLLRLSHVG